MTRERIAAGATGGFFAVILLATGIVWGRRPAPDEPAARATPPAGVGTRSERAGFTIHTTRDPADGHTPRPGRPHGDRTNADAGTVMRGRHALARTVTHYDDCPARCVLQDAGPEGDPCRAAHTCACIFWANDDECVETTMYAPDGAVANTIRFTAFDQCAKVDPTWATCDRVARQEHEDQHWRPTEEPGWDLEDAGP